MFEYANFTLSVAFLVFVKSIKERLKRVLYDNGENVTSEEPVEHSNKG